MSECTHDCSSCSQDCGERDKTSMLEKPHAQSKIKKVKKFQNVVYLLIIIC